MMPCARQAVNIMDAMEESYRQFRETLLRMKQAEVAWEEEYAQAVRASSKEGRVFLDALPEREETPLEIKAPEKVDWFKLATEICVDPQRYLRKEFAVPQSYVIRVYRDSHLLHSAMYQTSQIEDARAYAKGFYAWDRIERVELLLSNGAMEEIANP